jgi:murein DD-endopeptidase MepM/ murein hydrolase activator NlpD
VRHRLRQGLIGLIAAVVVGTGLPVGWDALRPTVPNSTVLSAQAAPGGAPGNRSPDPGSTGVRPPDQVAQGPTSAPPPTGLLALRAAARMGESWPTPPELLTGYVWPLPGGRITNMFGPSWASDMYVDGQRFHDGLDIATFCGGHILAAHDGVVLAAGRKVDPWMGWIGSLAPSVKRRDARGSWGSLPIVVVVDDGNGYRSIYAHFNAIVVKAGQRVRAGQFIGYEGATGFATGCHLHYGLFSPLETRTMILRPDVAKRTKLPPLEIARIDPLLVLLPDQAPSPAGWPGAGVGQPATRR